MSAIAEYSEQSELALAAYANLAPGVYPVPALLNEGMSATQAASFADRYTVISKSSASADGFSATLFLDNATGQKILSICGTEITDVGDLLN